MMVANGDIPDGQPGSTPLCRLAEQPAAFVLVARPRRLAGLRAVSVEHEIADAHVVRVPYEQHVEGGSHGVLGLCQENRSRSRAEDGRVGAELDRVVDDIAAPWKEENASALGVQGITGSEDGGEVPGPAVALRAVASHVEYPVGRQLQSLVLDDHVIDDEVVDIAVGAATGVA